MGQELRRKVLISVGVAGALTTRRVIGMYGPKINWQSLLDRHYLKEYQTLYGPVLAVGPWGRTGYLTRPPDSDLGHWPYIAGPTTVADRAFQNDAFSLLTDQGYVVKHHDYKRSGKVGTAARKGTGHTDQIIRTVMQVPDLKLRGLITTWGPGEHYSSDPKTHYLRPRGHPYLYASISNGGIGLTRLRALIRTHAADVNHWHSPLLVAVPEEGDLRSYLRGLDHKDRSLHDRTEREFPGSPKPFRSKVQLIILPLP